MSVRIPAAWWPSWNAVHEIAPQADDRDPRSESVQSVDDVDGIRDTNDPEDGDNRAEDSELESKIVRDRKRIDLHPSRDDEHRGEHLGEELARRLDVVDVVQKARDEHHRATGDNCRQSQIEGLADRGVEEWKPQESAHPDEERPEHGRAPQVGHWYAVNLPDSGFIHPTLPQGHASRHRSEQQRCQAGDHRNRDHWRHDHSAARAVDVQMVWTRVLTWMRASDSL